MSNNKNIKNNKSLDKTIYVKDLSKEVKKYNGEEVIKLWYKIIERK